MTRLRTLAALAALLVPALLPVTAQAAQAAQAAPERTDGAGSTQAPTVGECHQINRRQLMQMSHSADPVPCSSRHNLQVIAVATLPPGADWSATSTDIPAALAKHCVPAFETALGASRRTVAMSSYTWAYWIPTKAQRAAGARWIRCDAARWENGMFDRLDDDLRIRGPLTTEEQNCLTVTRTVFAFSSCSARHNWRAVKAVTAPGRSAKMPSREAFLRLGERRCPGEGDGTYFTWPDVASWAAGNHVLVCYLPAR